MSVQTSLCHSVPPGTATVRVCRKISPAGNGHIAKLWGDWLFKLQLPMLAALVAPPTTVERALEPEYTEYTGLAM